MEAELRQLASDHQVALEIALGAPDALVSLELGAPEEILLNLTAKALYAIPSGGLLRIETSLPAAVGRRFVLLCVGDSGPGTDPEARRRASEPFSATGRGSGTGLGLSMVQKFLSRAGGHLRLDSQPGQGTTVMIYLPVCGPAPSEE